MPRAFRKMSRTGMRSGSCAAARPPGAKASMTSVRHGPLPHLQTELTHFWPPAGWLGRHGAVSGSYEARLPIEHTVSGMSFRVHHTSSHQAASRSSVGGDTRFCPEGAAAGSHCTIASLKPQLRRNGPSTDLHGPPSAAHSSPFAFQ